MLNSTELARVLPMLPPRRLQHHAYRIVANKHLAANPPLHPDQYLYSLGALVAGARFTPRGGPATLYLAEDQQTAFDEANPEQAILRRADPGLVRPTPPGRYVSVLYQLESVLDLTDNVIQQALGTGSAELAGHWRQAQQRGRVAFCLAVFPDRLAAPAYVKVYDPDGFIQERLP